MAKHTVNGFITYEKPIWAHEAIVSFSSCDPTNYEWTEAVAVCPHSIEVDVPDDFNPTPQMVAALEEQKRQLRLKLASDLATIDDRISKLSAIAYEPPMTVGVFEDIDGVF
jgi:hypothetical protein